jgi:hypothetical protein
MKRKRKTKLADEEVQLYEEVVKGSKRAREQRNQVTAQRKDEQTQNATYYNNCNIREEK